MSKNPIMEKLRAKISPEDKILMDESFALADRINYLLKKHSITQRDLADRLHKSESEVSKWLSGGHNFTSHTLIKIGLAIGERIYNVPTASQDKTESIEHFESVLRSFIVRAFKQVAIEKNQKYKAYKHEHLSELEVNSTGVIINKNHVNSNDFTQAHLKPEYFKNIELANLN